MRVQERAVDSDQHTIGYKVGGRWITRRDAVRLAKKGKIHGVVACKGHYGEYIISAKDSTRLYDLPVKPQKSLRGGVLAIR